MRHSMRAVALASLAAVAACSADSTTAPAAAAVSALAPAVVSADLNNAVAADVKDQVAGISGGTATSGASLVANLSALPSADVNASCTFSPNTGMYTCTARTEGQFTVVRQFRIFSGGVALSPGAVGLPDSTQHFWLTTGRDSVVKEGAMRLRSIVRADTGTSVALRDTTPAKPVLQFTENGHGNKADTLIVRDSVRTRTYITVGTHVVSNLVRKAPENANPYPASGMITFMANITATAVGPGDANRETKSLSRTSVVTFNGTATATLVADGKTCDIDLPTKTVSNCR